MQCPLPILQAVGMFCRGGKAMNEPSTSSFFVVLLFILRCFIPLAILFGISYLLRRMGLVATETTEPREKSESLVETTSSKKSTRATPTKKTQKSKSAPPRKKHIGDKPAGRTKTGNSRSRSK
jgi:hypothetical protein